MSALRRLAVWLAAIVIAGCTPVGEEEPSSYITADAEIGDIRDIVPAVGPLRAATEVEVGAEVSGRILEVHVDFNDPVQRGQLLALIDPAPFESALDQAHAQEVIAEADLRDAEAELGRTREARERLARLVERGAGRRADLTDLEYRLEALEARVNRARGGADLARGRVRQAEIDLARTEIRSPSDGFILDRRIEEGQAVNAVQSAPTLFVVTSDLDLMFVEAAVSEADIGRIQADMTVRFTVDAYPDTRFSGRIASIRQAPQRRGRFVSYIVLVAAENRFGQLMSGMTAAVEFVRTDAREVLRIPVEALYFEPSGYEPSVSEASIRRFERARGPLSEDAAVRRATLSGLEMGALFRAGNRRIFVARPDGGWERREVRIGGEDETHVEIVSGPLEPGEPVILAERG